MKFYSREHVADYSTYQFGYCNYAEREAGDPLKTLYNMGYLPYSADPSTINTFYMARSARVRLADFVPSSENRRVLKKFDGAVTCTLIPVAGFDLANKDFQTFCLDYFSREHGPDVMPLWRLRHILAMPIISHVARFADGNGTAIGYVLLAMDGVMSHYWFSFYAAAMQNKSFGMYMMLHLARNAAAQDCEYYYLGTAYGNGGRYKLNFPALEYWTGNGWSADQARLKAHLLADSIAA